MMTDEQNPTGTAGAGTAAPTPPSGYDAYAYMAKDAERFDAAHTPPAGVTRSGAGRLGRLGPRRAAAVIGVVACALAIGGTAIAATRGTPQSTFGPGGRGGFGGPGQFGGNQNRQFGGGQFGPGQNGQGQGQAGQGQTGQGQVGQTGQRPNRPQVNTTSVIPALPPNKTSGDGSTDSATPVTTSLTT